MASISHVITVLKQLEKELQDMDRLRQLEREVAKVCKYRPACSEDAWMFDLLRALLPPPELVD
jgi:hypothetical protein